MRGIDRLQLHECCFACTRAHRCAHGRHAREVSLCLQKSELSRICLAKTERECEIATQNGLSLPRKPLDQRRRKRIHPRNGGNPEQDARDENVKAAHASAHLARRHARGEEQPAGAAR